MKDVVIAGIGFTDVGEHWDQGLDDLFINAAKDALKDSQIMDIEALYVGNMLGMFAGDQGHLGSYLADKMSLGPIHAVSLDGACTSAGLAMSEAYWSVASGRFESVLVGGVEKMSDMMTKKAVTGLSFAEDVWHMDFSGATFACLNALTARLYMEKYKIKREQLLALAVQAHENGSKSKHAHFRKPITMDKAINAPMISDPLGLYDSSPISDGAAALVLISKETAKKRGLDYVEVIGSGVSTQVMSLHERKDMLFFEATYNASKKAFEQAKLMVNDIDVMEIHDAFTITGFLALEAMGFSKPGEATKLVSDGKTNLQGDIPINTFGGLKARGHPVGATGIYQICELVLQLMGKAGNNQVEKDLKYALSQCVGGVDSTSSVHILKAMEK